MKILSEYYKEKIKVMRDSLIDNGLDSFKPPTCGFFVLLDLKKDSWKVFNEAIKRGVSFVPAKPFFLRGGETMARLSVSVATKEQIVKGVRIIRESINAV